MPKSETFNMDCIEYLKQCKDKQFSLLYTDPPYGDPAGAFKNSKYGRFGGLFTGYHEGLKMSSVNHANGGNLFGKYGDECAHWDKAPSDEFWEQAFRVADHLIIWGGNYFDLPPSRNFIIWEKGVPATFSMAMCEYAWVSFDGNAKIVRARAQDKFRFHPTAKPVLLSMEVFKLWGEYAKPKGIIDPFMGSGSFRIAAWKSGLDYTGIELDKNYFTKEEERFKDFIAEGDMFASAGMSISESEEGLF
jgi:site-specific DNA-methyltransferase (adenine-specific)